MLRSGSSFYVNKLIKAEAESFIESFFLDYPIHIFDKSSLKSFNNIYQNKIILKTHLFIKNILGSLLKLFQCNKNLSKHQTKVNTAINTNLLN